MALQFSPFGNDQFFTSNGVLAVGYKLFTYMAGTTTKFPVYTDIAGTTPHTNPIILNALGMPPSSIFLNKVLLYKFVLAAPTDTDPPSSPIVTNDNVGVAEEGSGSSVIATGSTTPRLLADRFAAAINVKDEGAVGDGVADDRQAFVDTDADTTGPITVSEGTYLISSNLTITSPVKFMGGVLKPAAGVTITLSGGVVPTGPIQQLFDITAVGSSISLPNTGTICPDWFGGKTSEAVKGAVAAAADGAKISFQLGPYTCSSEIISTKPLVLEGVSSEGTHLNFNDCDGIDFQLTGQETEHAVIIQDLTISSNALGTRRAVKYSGPVSTGATGTRLTVRNCSFLGTDRETGSNTQEWKTCFLLSQNDGTKFENVWGRGKESAFQDAFDTATTFISSADVTHLTLEGVRIQRMKTGLSVTGLSEGVEITNGSSFVALDTCVVGSSLTVPSNNWTFSDSHFAAHTTAIDIQQVSGAAHGTISLTIRNNFFIQRDDLNAGGNANFRHIKAWCDKSQITNNGFHSSATILPITKSNAAIELTGGRFCRVNSNTYFNSGIGLLVDSGVDDTLAFGNGCVSTSERTIPLLDNGTRTIHDTSQDDATTPANTGTAQAGAASTITLTAGASAIDNFYRGLWINLLTGTGEGQTRFISSYVGSTKVATLANAWGINPDATSTYEIVNWTTDGGHYAKAVRHDFYTNGGLALKITNGATTTDTNIDVFGDTQANGYATVRASSPGGATAGNVDLRLTGIGTGKVRFGTHTALGAETVTGYITIKDSGGTTRKIAVVS